MSVCANPIRGEIVRFTVRVQMIVQIERDWLAKILGIDNVAQLFAEPA